MRTFIIVSCVVILFAVAAFGASKYEPTYHLVKVDENGKVSYAIQQCFFGCSLLGYRYNMDRLHAAEETYDYFTKKKKSTIIEVVK